MDDPYQVWVNVGELFSDCFDELEMRNKDRRKGRLRFSRKNSRENNTKDMYHYLLRSSDPLVNNS